MIKGYDIHVEHRKCAKINKGSIVLMCFEYCVTHDVIDAREANKYFDF